MRSRVAIAMIVFGIVLMVLGYSLSAPWGATGVADSNPSIDFAPTIFVLGVIMTFSAALVYELLPDRKRR
jgi:uncharacterized BrkB/YihY/UPF0761 family membrane protein